MVKEHGTIPVNSVVLAYGTDEISSEGVKDVPISEEMVAEVCTSGHVNALDWTLGCDTGNVESQKSDAHSCIG